MIYYFFFHLQSTTLQRYYSWKYFLTSKDLNRNFWKLAKLYQNIYKIDYLAIHLISFGQKGKLRSNWFPIATNLQIDTKVKSLGLSKLKLTVPNFDRQNDQKWPFWPFRSIWGVWQWPQVTFHVPKPGDRHQNQVSRTFQTKVTNLAIFGYIWFSVPKWNRRARIENIVLSW